MPDLFQIYKPETTIVTQLKLCYRLSRTKLVAIFQFADMYNQPQVYPQMAYGAIPQMPQGGGGSVNASVAAAPLGQSQTTSAPNDPFAF